MMDFMSDEENKSIGNAGNSSKYTDLKANCTWGNYKNTTLTQCEGKYCIMDSNGSIISDWEENTTKTNRVSSYTLLTTGETEEVKKKNIYDVAGNLTECVQETAGGMYTSYRGGCFANNYERYTACYRECFDFGSAFTTLGFRPVLYIK